MVLSFERLSLSEAAPPGDHRATTYRVCIAQPRRSIRVDAMTGPVEAMMDSGVIQWKLDDPHATGLVEMARQIAGFRIEHDRVICPVVVVRESDELSYDMATLDITFGDVNDRPKMMTQSNMKLDILSKMQGRPDVCRDQCHGVLVGLKGIECLVLISLKATDMRLHEIQNGEQPDGLTGHYASETIALFRCLDVLARLAPYVHTFGDGIVYGFKTPVVNGNSQRVTKSHVRVSKLLWRGIFDGHPILMAPSLVERVFQPRYRSMVHYDSPTTMHPVST